MSAQTNAVRLGVRRGWTEFSQSIRSTQDQGFYLFTGLVAVGYLFLRRDTPVEGTDLMLPSVATIIPLYVFLNQFRIEFGDLTFNLRASLVGVSLAVVSSQLPFAIWNLKGYLDTIPRDLEEAASVDGANAFQRFVHVTLPGLRNIVIIVVLLSTIWTFNDFAIVYILTKGGPGGATMVLPVFTYELAFGAQRLGDAIAVALYMLPPLAVVIIVLARYMRRGHAR